ncbi:MAG: hypothetical protein LBK61_08235 [Spirochaetaceae bacterium]|nr:hypothetical protein [Spirochaetaceae bacterium]
MGVRVSPPAKCPCGERKPAGFSSFCESFPSCETCPFLNPTPILAEESAGTMPDWGRMNK